MGGFSMWHWLLVGVVALLLFGGKGKISDIMGDVAKGIKSFKKGLTEDDEADKKPPAVDDKAKTIDHAAPGAMVDNVATKAQESRDENRKAS